MPTDTKEISKTPLLQVSELCIDFKTSKAQTRAVENVNFDILNGETIGVVGESGSGKSITALSIMGLIPSPPGFVTKGSILYERDGQVTDLVQLGENQMRPLRGNEIGMVFQEPMTSLNPVLRCGEQVAEALIEHKKITKKEAKEQTLHWFNEVQLPRGEQLYKSYPHQLSGGQKQRVMIAMAMCCQPRILIADEPTTALDVTVQKAILKLIKRLQAQHKMSVIFISHDLGVIAQMAQKVLVMYRGKIVERGTVKQIFESPKHPYTKGLLACRPPLEYKLKRLPTVNDFLEQEKNNKEGNSSIEQQLTKVRISQQEILKRTALLYKQNPVLTVKNLKVHFPVRKNWLGAAKEWVRAVDGVSFEVFPGETLGLVGESGCGKTTLGRTILNLVRPSAGEVFYKDQSVFATSQANMRQLRKQMQIVFQDPYSSLNPRMTVGEAIMEPMKVHRIHVQKKNRIAKTHELLEKVGLKDEHFHRYPHEFSGGQRQRVCIARALALEPEFIICDESVSALDVSVQAQVLNLLNQLKEELQLTYIFISHDLSVVKYMSDRVIVMKEGKIEELGDAESIYRNPKSSYTKLLIDSIPKGETTHFAQ